MSEDHRSGHDTLESAVREFQRMPAPDRPSDEALLALLATHRPAAGRSLLFPYTFTRRFLMRPAFRYTVAAVVVVALGWLLMGPAGTIALADVVKAAKKHSFVHYTETQVTEGKGNGMRGELTWSVDGDLKVARYRKVSRIKYADGEAILVDVQDLPRGVHLMTNSREKTAWISRHAPKWTKTFVESLQELQQKKGVTSAKERLEERETVKFLVEKDGGTVTLWIDSTTRLPVRLEYEFPLNKIIWSDFQWDPEVKEPDRLFNTEIPEGYAVTEDSGPAKKDR
ncbi:hypothetical protein SAMN05444166_1326 [Singulisphaera sp. GP187]|uniref:hypothetical protein n=1 Tax=Singulisphaera sp. GP187 TaxID=1882752 RepID=UPI00092CE170|nr:hypothetical protein [Singulisphaera sp. GP187]SIN86301.1 hypothetical protein SAMN05444166_1326 [Singulisphaera sp. GP187]